MLRMLEMFCILRPSSESYQEVEYDKAISITSPLVFAKNI